MKWGQHLKHCNNVMLLSEILLFIPKYFRKRVSKNNFYEFSGYDVIINFSVEPDGMVKYLVFCKITPNTGRHLWDKVIYSVSELKKLNIL